MWPQLRDGFRGRGTRPSHATRTSPSLARPVGTTETRVREQHPDHFVADVFGVQRRLRGQRLNRQAVEDRVEPPAPGQLAVGGGGDETLERVVENRIPGLQARLD